MYIAWIIGALVGIAYYLQHDPSSLISWATLLTIVKVICTFGVVIVVDKVVEIKEDAFAPWQKIIIWISILLTTPTFLSGLAP